VVAFCALATIWRYVVFFFPRFLDCRELHLQDLHFGDARVRDRVSSPSRFAIFSFCFERRETEPVCAWLVVEGRIPFQIFVYP